MDRPQVHGGVIWTSSRTSSKCLKILPKTIPKTCLFSPYKFWHFSIFCYFHTNNAGAVSPRKRCLHGRRVCSNLSYINLAFFSSFVKKLCVSLRHTWALDMAILNPLEDLGIDIKRVQPQLLKVVYIECSFRHFSILNIWYNDSWPFSSSCTSHFHRNWKK